MKKWISVLLVSAILLSLAGCSAETSAGYGETEAAAGAGSDERTVAAGDEDTAGKESGETEETTGEETSLWGTPASEELVKHCSDSSDTDNIALRFFDEVVLRINDEGIGRFIELTDGDFTNSVFTLNNFCSSGYNFSNMWGFSSISFSYDKLDIEEISEYYPLVGKTDSCYLFHTPDLPRHYRIIIDTPDNDYNIQVTTDSESEDEMLALLDRLDRQTEIAYVEFDLWDYFVRSSVSETDTTFKDLSDWRFLEDMIWEYYADYSLCQISSVCIDDFDFSSDAATTSVPAYFYEGKAYCSAFSAYTIDYDRFCKTSVEEDTYPVNISAFDEAYVQQHNGGNADVIVRTERDCYRIETGVPFEGEDDVDKVAAVFEQVYYYPYLRQ